MAASTPAKEVARRWFDEVINQRRVDAVDEIYAPQYVHHGSGGRDVGRDEARAIAQRLLDASEDRHATVLDQLQEGDRVATRWQSVGTFEGGKRATIRGIIISRVAGDRIAEEWEVVDHYSFLQDLGELPGEDE
jgi:predicted SnoaL-like aldol condensation-catalyzing enzyme